MIFSSQQSISTKINLAKRITKKFIRLKKELSPTISFSWEFKMSGNKVKIISDDVIYDEISFEFYAKQYLFSEDFIINDNKLDDPYYYTSIGFISERDYFMAEDIMESYAEAIKLKDLVVNHIYLSDKGEKFLFLGSLDIDILEVSHHIKGKIRIYKERQQIKPLFYNIKTKKIIRASSVKIISYFEKNHTEIEINDGFFKYFIQNNFYYIHPLENVSFKNSYIERFFSVNNDIQDFEKALDFIVNSKENSIDLNCVVTDNNDMYGFENTEISYFGESNNYTKYYYDSYGNLYEDKIYK